MPCPPRRDTERRGHRGDVRSTPVRDERLLERRAQPFGHRCRLAQVGVGDEDHELLTALAVEAVGGPRRRRERVRDASEDVVADPVAALLVDEAEVVEVDEDQPVGRTVLAWTPRCTASSSSSRARGWATPCRRPPAPRAAGVRCRRRGASISALQVVPALTDAALSRIVHDDAAAARGLAGVHGPVGTSAAHLDPRVSRSADPMVTVTDTHPSVPSEDDQVDRLGDGDAERVPEQERCSRRAAREQDGELVAPQPVRRAALRDQREDPGGDGGQHPVAGVVAVGVVDVLEPVEVEHQDGPAERLRRLPAPRPPGGCGCRAR